MIDIIIICIVVAAILFGIYKFAVHDMVNKTEKTYKTFMFVCESAPNIVVKNIAFGAPAVDHSNDTSLGSVTVLAQGQLDDASKPDYSLVKFKTVVNGTPAKNGFKVGGQLYLAGQTLALRVGDSLLPVYIGEISDVSDSGEIAP